MDADTITSLYQDWQLAKRTGWTLEYIESLGLLKAEAFLQFEDAENAIVREKNKK